MFHKPVKPSLTGVTLQGFVFNPLGIILDTKLDVLKTRVDSILNICQFTW